MMKFALSGGHLTPAFSFSEIASKNGDTLMLIGSAGADSTEAKELAKLGARYGKIRPVKLDRYHIAKSLLKLPLLAIPVWESYQYLKEFKPDVVLTFGGFNAVPVALAAKLLGIPYIVHEQTMDKGLANRLISPAAAKNIVSYQESKSLFAAGKTMVIGNLIRSEIWQPPDKCPVTLPTQLPILFVTGGNQGSKAILNALAPLLPQLSKRYQVVVQYGKNSGFTDSLTPTVVAQSWFDAPAVSFFLHNAKIIISRSGANTASEIMIAGTPAVLVPLPNTSQNEQYKNARLIADNGAGVIVFQHELNPQKLLVAIEQIEKEYSNIKQNAVKLKNLQHPQAASDLYKLTVQLISSR